MATRRPEQVHDIQFISYDGKWPNLCAGTLKLVVNGTEHELRHALHSTGTCVWEPPSEDNDWCGREIIEPGIWHVDFTFADHAIFGDDSELLRREIEWLANNEWPIDKPCCGGCM